MSSYYSELGGGLGDVFQMLYETGFTEALNHPDYLKPDDTITIAIISHNPHVAELFANHPKRSQMAILQLPYWTPEENESKRRQYNLPPFSDHPYQMRPTLWKLGPGEVQFYPSRFDALALANIEDAARGCPLVVFSVSAGLKHRNFPGAITTSLLRNVEEAGFLPVLVGRRYERFDREEIVPEESCAVNALDLLTVPGVAQLVQKSAGVVCCHSSINMLASYERKPQLLLYDDATAERHFRQVDQWSFMQDFPEVTHGTFARFLEGDGEMMARFLEGISPSPRFA